MGTALRTDLDNWSALDTYLDDKNERTCGNNTTMFRHRDGSIGVVLHSTEVVTAHPDGTFTLNSGGWQTVTTKDRINRHTPLGIRVHAKDYEWFVTVDDDTFPFADGITVGP